MEERVNDLLPLAAKIAREFSNIPGLPHSEIEMAAQEALAHAARLFDPAKGDFTAYAARAMRNTLRDLYERQVRHHQHHVYNLDLPITQFATTPEARIQQVPSPNVLTDQAAALESGERLEQAMGGLSPRLRLVARGIRDGKTYSEIGTALGISKQAAHKLAGAAIATLREKLEAMGFQGLDTLVCSKVAAASRRRPCWRRRGSSHFPLKLTISRLNRNPSTERPMSTVHLQVLNPDGTSKSFALTEHDTFLLGRMADCHLCVPGDSQVSRHHFLLEACPPMASLRDLGSMNGTHINGKKCGGREKGETPEQGALRQYPSIDLKNGDRITVGQSTIEVRVETKPDAAVIPAALPEGDLSGLSPEAMRQLIFGSPEKAIFTLADYAVQRELGRGGCGAVYLATPKSGGDPVAVKLMLSRA